MTRRTLSVLAALALLVSVGTANAAPMPANPMPGHRPKAPAPKDKQLELTFAALPTGWTGEPISAGSERGPIAVVTSPDGKTGFMALSADLEGAKLEDLVKATAHESPPGMTCTKPVKHANGDWSYDMNGTIEGKEVHGSMVFRTFKADPDGVYVFLVSYEPGEPAATKAQARTIIDSATLK